MRRVADMSALAIIAARPLLNVRTRTLASVIALLLVFPAAAEPVRLKLSFFASERTETYESGIKPFVDGINTEGQGLLAIDVHADGALGRALGEQPGLVLDGVADIAWVAPGQTPYRFPDNELLELPGQIGDVREGTLAFTRLIAAKALRGYQEFFVIGAYTAAPTIIHSRRPIESLAALKGQKIRANNPVGAEALQRLGATPTVLPASQIAAAIDRGALDGAALDPTGLFDFGVERSARNHYLLRGGVAPLVLVMNRKKFDDLPEAAKALIRKYSGEAAAAAWVGTYGRGVRQSLEKIKSGPERKVVEPSAADLETARRVYRSMIDDWAAKDARNRELVAKIESELATIRSGRP